MTATREMLVTRVSNIAHHPLLDEENETCGNLAGQGAAEIS